MSGSETAKAGYDWRFDRRVTTAAFSVRMLLLLKVSPATGRPPKTSADRDPPRRSVGTSHHSADSSSHSGGAREDAGGRSPASRTEIEPSADRTRKLWTTILSLGLVAAGVGILWRVTTDRDAATPVAAASIPPRYEADRAMGYLVRLCEFGPRPSGSDAMKSQTEYLQTFFESSGATVRLQTFEIRHPLSGEIIELRNLIAEYRPEATIRFLMCAHYDTRPFPDRDRRHPRGIFLGANDGAGGTAALMEMSHHIEGLPPDVGVDIVLFDGEELIYRQGTDQYFLGSTHFARQHAAQPPPVPYRAGVLLDMVADKELRLYYERNSLRMAPKVAREIWGVAKEIGATAFVPRVRHEVQDDHLPLNQIARIPTVDIIDFDYPRPGMTQPSYWHTEADVPENCSGESMAQVVWVLDQWLRKQSRLP